MLRKKSRREQVITLDAISALFKDQLLPADNKLTKFESVRAKITRAASTVNRHNYVLSSRSVPVLLRFFQRSMDSLNGKSKTEREEMLVSWYLEDQLKDRYLSFLMTLETLLKDPIEFTRLKALGISFTAFKMSDCQ